MTTLIAVALGWAWQAVDVEPLTGRPAAHPRDRGPGPADLAALEHALRLADSWRARVVAATVGPPAADAMLRAALAAGADSALRIEPPGAGGPDPAGLIGGGPEAAAALADALAARFGIPDLVLCGDRSADRGTASFPAFLAARLGAAQALGAVRLEVAGDRALRVHRRLDGGRREVLLARPPAVVSVEAAGVRPRRASLAAALASEAVSIPVAPLPAAGPSRVRVLGSGRYRPRPREISRPAGPVVGRLRELTGAAGERVPPTVTDPLPPDQAAAALLDFLRQHGYLTPGAQILP